MTQNEEISSALKALEDALNIVPLQIRILCYAVH